MISYLYFNLGATRFLISFEVFYTKSLFYCLGNISFLTSCYLFLKGSIFLLYFCSSLSCYFTLIRLQNGIQKKKNSLFFYFKTAVCSYFNIYLYAAITFWLHSVIIVELCSIEARRISIFTDHAFSKRIYEQKVFYSFSNMYRFT